MATNRWTRCGFVSLFLLFALISAGAQDAQPRPRVQIIEGIIPTAGKSYYRLPALQAGQTLYISARATDGNDDPRLSFGRFAFYTPLVFDKPENSGARAQLQHDISTDGDYSLALTSNDASETTYRLVIGIDAQHVLEADAATISATPQTDDIATAYTPSKKFFERVTDCSSQQRRPQLSGPVRRHETPLFIVHYTTEGRDGATPAFVQAVADAVSAAWEHHIHEMGWPPPPPDCGEGGDRRFDVYIKEVIRNNILGSAMREGIVLDNPHTPTLEQFAAYSSLLVDNDFVSPLVDDPLGVMRSTVAHELMHNIQFGYDLADEFFSFYEASATWVETQTFPAEQDATRYVDAYFAYPDICLGYYEYSGDLRERMYGEWLLVDTLVRDYGLGALQRIWQGMTYDEGLPAFYAALSAQDIEPQTLLLHTAIRNLLRDYTIAPRFGDKRVRVESNINGIGRITPRSNGVQQLGVDYLLVTDPQRYTFSVDQPDLRLYLVGIDQPRQQASVYDLGQRGTVDTAQYSYSYVIILNSAQHSDLASCTYTEWELQVSFTDDAASEPLAQTWNATHFIPAG